MNDIPTRPAPWPNNTKNTKSWNGEIDLVVGVGDQNGDNTKNPKYTVVHHVDPKTKKVDFYALRYGDTWMEDLISTPGRNMIYQLAYELAEARKKLAAVKKLADAGDLLTISAVQEILDRG